MIGNLLRWLVAAAVLYALAAFAAFLSQEFFLFPGRRTTNGQRAVGVSNDYEQLHLDIEGVGQAYGLYRHVNDARHAALVFLDDDECVANALPVLEAFAGIGIAALCVDYPGYGGSLGKPSADHIRTMAQACYQNLVNTRDFDERRVWMVGRGFGSGPACYVAAHWTVAGVVLLAPATSFKAQAALRYRWLPVRQLMRHEFDNAAQLAGIRQPTFIAWCQDDARVPAAMPERLVQVAAGPVTRWTQPTGGHDGVRIEPNNALIRAIEDFIRSR